MQPEVLFKETPPEVFLTAWCVADNYTCKPLSSSHRGESAGSFTHPLLYTQRGQPNHLSYFSLSRSPLLSERSLWLRERLGASESIIYQSRELTGIIETINVGAIFHGRTGTNKNTNRVDSASARPRSSCDSVPSLSLWMNEWWELRDTCWATKTCVKMTSDGVWKTDLDVWFNTRRKKRSTPEMTLRDEVINIRQSHAPRGVKHFSSLTVTLPESFSLLSICSSLLHFSVLSLPTICHSPGGYRDS